jgi:hypothetical protein
MVNRMWSLSFWENEKLIRRSRFLCIPTILAVGAMTITSKNAHFVISCLPFTSAALSTEFPFLHRRHFCPPTTCFRNLMTPMRSRRASAIALVTAAIQGKKPHHHHSLTSAFSSRLTLPRTTITKTSSSAENSCPPSTMHHRIRTRATPIVDDQYDLPSTVESTHNRTDSPRTNSNIEIINGNQEESTLLEKAKVENEAALAILLLNVVAIIWGTQVSPWIDPLFHDENQAPTCATIQYSVVACGNQTGSRRFLRRTIYIATICTGCLDCRSVYSRNLSIAWCQKQPDI